MSLWFKCLDLFKIIKPLKFFDLSLLNNLTNDLPHVMPINEIIHTQASASSSDNADTTNSTYQINLNTSVLQIDDEKCLDNCGVISNLVLICLEEKN